MLYKEEVMNAAIKGGASVEAITWANSNLPCANIGGEHTTTLAQVMSGIKWEHTADKLTQALSKTPAMIKTLFRKIEDTAEEAHEGHECGTGNCPSNTYVLVKLIPKLTPEEIAVLLYHGTETLYREVKGRSVHNEDMEPEPDQILRALQQLFPGAIIASRKLKLPRKPDTKKVTKKPRKK